VIHFPEIIRIATLSLVYRIAAC